MSIGDKRLLIEHLISQAMDEESHSIKPGGQRRPDRDGGPPERRKICD
jgi:hypothetical protein